MVKVGRANPRELRFGSSPRPGWPGRLGQKIRPPHEPGLSHWRRADGDEVGFLRGSSEGFCLAFDAVSGEIVSICGQDAHHFVWPPRHPWILPVKVDGLANGEFMGHGLTASLALSSGRARKAPISVDAGVLRVSATGPERNFALVSGERLSAKTPRTAKPHAGFDPPCQYIRGQGERSATPG